MNIEKSAGFPVPYVDTEPRTISEWLSFRFLDFIAWRFGHKNIPLSIINYPTARPDPVNPYWPKDSKAEEALRVLRREFSRFSVDGLRRLGRAISRGFVPGSDWNNSILSFRLGFYGSAVMDSEGNTENAFTIYWNAHSQEIDLAWVLYEIRAKL